MLLFSTRGWCPLLVINVQIFLVLISALGGHATHYTEDIDIQLPDVHLDLTANHQLVVIDDDDSNVTCVSSLNSSSTLSWYRVSGAQEAIVAGTNLSTTNTTSKLQLTITIADLMNAASVEYYCTARNSLGTARSRFLSVHRAWFGGFSTASGVVNVTVRTRHAVALYCGVDDSLPVPAIRWLRSGTPVNISLARYRVLDNAQYLVIYNLMDSDIQVSGVPVNYQCQVTNANISFVVTSATVYNFIKTDLFANKFMTYRHPNNLIVLSNVTSADMFTVYFIAAINGLANEINYKQFPSGIINRDDLSITYTGSQLEEEATQRDGLIMITLQQQTTPFAGSTANVTVTLLDPFVIISAVPTGVTCGFTGDEFSFNCTATGTGVQLIWYRNAIRITPYPGSTLTITDATPTDSGVYQCHWYSQQLGVYHIVTWALVISEPAKRPIVTVFRSIPAESEPNRTIVADCCVPVTFLLEVRVDRLPEIRWMFKGVPISDNNTNYNISDTVGEERGEEHYLKSNLTILRVTMATVGEYNAVINDNITDPVISPTQLVSLPLNPVIILTTQCPLTTPTSQCSVVSLITLVTSPTCTTTSVTQDTMLPITLGVGIPVTFLLTAIISSLLTLLITYLCMSRGKSHMPAQEPVYDSVLPAAQNPLFNHPGMCTSMPVPSTGNAIELTSNMAYGQSGVIVHEPALL